MVFVRPSVSRTRRRWCLLNTFERDGAEHGPLDGAEILLEDSANKVEDEDGESDAGMGDVEGEPDLRVPGECVIWVLRLWWRRQRIGLGRW
ncbi:hypothetical protein FH972_019608 [Carpinus fangiana]|uniref:Uncharacterized protein n=1 Tax=Carpinus fangiana TaxID=176857 RepID=A0A5N6RTL8_9ROSI|nr:hypothetical protein FH972_019608 [Carpinus fangiana]